MYRGILVLDIRITSLDKILSIVYENRFFNILLVSYVW